MGTLTPHTDEIPMTKPVPPTAASPHWGTLRPASKPVAPAQPVLLKDLQRGVEVVEVADTQAAELLSLFDLPPSPTR